MLVRQGVVITLHHHLFHCSIQTDGKISHVEVFGFQKRYNPEKFYVCIISHLAISVALWL